MKRVCKVMMLVAMMAVVLMSMTGCGKTKLDLAEGLVVTFSGVDGSGTADLDFPENDGTPTYVNTILESKKVDITNMMTWMMIDEAITYDIEPRSHLSNGDVVTVSATVNDAILDNLKLSAKPFEMQVTVTGLQEVQEVDAFADFEVSYTGVSPDAKVSYTKSREIDGVTVSYSCDAVGYVREGDTVTFKAKLSNSKYYRLKEETKTFTVTNVDKYITSSQELKPENFNAMREKADKVVADTISRWEGHFHYSGFEYVGYEFWSNDEGAIMRSPNAVYLYYRIDASDEDGEFPVYYHVSFNYIVQHADGTQTVDVEDYGKSSNPGLWSLLKDFGTLEARSADNAGRHGTHYNIEKFF